MGLSFTTFEFFSSFPAKRDDKYYNQGEKKREAERKVSFCNYNRFCKHPISVL